MNADLAALATTVLLMAIIVPITAKYVEPIGAQFSGVRRVSPNASDDSVGNHGVPKYKRMPRAQLAFRARLGPLVSRSG